MARITGRNARLYAAIAPGGTAEPVAFLDQWTLDQTSADIDVTTFDDENKTYLKDVADAKGTYKGYYDTETAQLYTAAADGLARKLYLYPDRTTNTKYHFGTATFDITTDTSQAGAVAISGTFSPASKIIKVG